MSESVATGLSVSKPFRNANADPASASRLALDQSTELVKQLIAKCENARAIAIQPLSKRRELLEKHVLPKLGEPIQY